MNSGEPRTGAAGVISVGTVAEGVRLMLRETTGDKHSIAIGSQRREDRRQLECGPFALRRPVVDSFEIPCDAVRSINETEPPNRSRRGLGTGCEGRRHGVQQRQRQRRACPTQESPARKSLSGDDHEALLMRNGVLCTMLIISDCKRWSAAAVSPKIVRTAGAS